MSDTSSESVSIAIGKSFGRLEALRMAARKFDPEERDLDEAKCHAIVEGGEELHRVYPRSRGVTREPLRSW